MEKKTSSSVVYDIIKVITVLLVVLAHSTRMYTPEGAFSPLLQSEFLAKTTQYIYTFHMPLFIFVSGAVYALCIQMGKYTDSRAFLSNKAKRLLAPYFIFGFLYVAPVMCLTGLATQSFFAYCYNGIVLSLNSRHLWFLEALFWIFVFTVPIRKWFLKSHVSRFVLLILSVSAYAASRFMPDEFQINAAFNYQIFFVMGAVFHFYYDRLLSYFMRFKYVTWLLPIIMLGIFVYNPNAITKNIYRVIGIIMILMVSLFLAEWTKISESKLFLLLKDYSMGIYLFHPMIIYLGYYWLGSKPIPPAILSSGIATASIVLSVATAKLVRKLKLGFIMGERNLQPRNSGSQS